MIAAELGDVRAASLISGLLDEADLARWIWMGRAALHGVSDSFFALFHVQVERFFSGSGNASIVFLIGRALKGSIELDLRSIFGYSFGFSQYIGPANQAVSFYDAQTKSARLAVDTWTKLFAKSTVNKNALIQIYNKFGKKSKRVWLCRCLNMSLR